MNPNELAETIVDETPEEVVELEEVPEEETDIKDDVEEPQEEEESVADLKKRIATLQAQKEHYRQKATKQSEEKPEGTPNVSLADLKAISNVHEDDIERVERYARNEGLTIREAMKDPELKAILALRAENRTTANATNTGNSRRGAVKLTPDVLIANAQAGKLPDDDAGIEALIAAKRKLK